MKEINQFIKNKLEIEKLTEENKKLQLDILPALLDDPELGETPIGKLSPKTMKRWKYPERVTEMKKDLMDKVKVEEEKAKSEGTATAEESQTLQFTKIKL